ncbi:hypothetical protein OW763_06805 [Clostridium aestuarii]|uniref:Uncharacterized protein n=1 Tax=Clostridium aestuarii TaxID=338193 RepID=A0ABT4D1N6_9CLOT|nr:hypothetical protein [Clostridium aestuarii]MCY6484060.1 hypothetical protein [Clostridium aestuarii]
MYDAKQQDEKQNENLKFNCIADRSYFNKISNTSIINLKSSYIANDNIVGEITNYK